MKNVVDFKRGDIVKLKSDTERYCVTRFHVDEIFVGKTGGEVLYRMSFKEKHTDHPKTHLTDGWGFEIAPKEK